MTPSGAGSTTVPTSAGCGANSPRSAAPTRGRPGERGRDPDRGGTGTVRGDRRRPAALRAPRDRRGGRTRGTHRGDGPGTPDALRGRPRDHPPSRRRAGRGSGPIRVEILPTFVGCPALELIKSSIAERLGAFGRPVEVTATFEVPWTSERISPAGRAALLAAGIAPPGDGAVSGAPGGLIDLEPRVPCPHCGSRRTVVENLFGPTQCRTIRYCADCRQPFESIKSV